MGDMAGKLAFVGHHDHHQQRIAPDAGQVQRRLAPVVRQGGVGAVFHQKGACLHKSPESSQVQRRAAVLVPGIDLHARLDEQPGGFHSVMVGRHMQQRFVLEPRFHGVGTTFDHLLKLHGIVAAHGILDVGPAARQQGEGGEDRDAEAGGGCDRPDPDYPRV